MEAISPRLSTRTVGHRLAPVAAAPPTPRDTNSDACRKEKNGTLGGILPKRTDVSLALPPIPLMSELNLEQVSNYR